MIEDKPQSILAHLEELRWRVVKIFIAVLVGGAVALIFADQLRVILEAPFHAAAPTNELQTLAATEQWGVLMRIGLFGGVILASPIDPLSDLGLHPAGPHLQGAKLGAPHRGCPRGALRRRCGLRLSDASPWARVPPQIFPDVETNLRLGDYYSFTLRFLLAFGLAFLFPVFLFAAAAAGIISSKSARPWATLGSPDHRHRRGADHAEWRRVQPAGPVGSPLSDVRGYLLAGPSGPQEMIPILTVRER